MRINVYSQELTSEIDRVTKFGTDKDGNPAQFHAVRLYLHSAAELHHTPDDDDRSAVTIWLPRSLQRRVELAVALRALAAWAEGPWPGGWAGWQDGPAEIATKIKVEKAALAEADPVRCQACGRSTICPGITGGVDACPRWQEAEARRAHGEYLTTRPAAVMSPADREADRRIAWIEAEATRE